jgi:hypothetical protein
LTLILWPFRIAAAARSRETQVAAWKLAAELSGPLRVEARLRQYAEQTYLWALSQAQAGSLNEEYPDPYPDSPSVAVRA